MKGRRQPVQQQPQNDPFEDDDFIEEDQVGDEVGVPEDLVDVGDKWVVAFIPSNLIGLVIGKGGETIKHIKEETGCAIHTEKQERLSGYRLVHIEGARCWEAFVDGVFASFSLKQENKETDVVFSMPRSVAGNIMGVGGATIKQFRSQFNTIDLQMQDCGRTLRYFQMKGVYDELKQALHHFAELYFNAPYWTDQTPKVEDFKPASTGALPPLNQKGGAPDLGMAAQLPMMQMMSMMQQQGRKRGRDGGNGMMNQGGQKRHQPDGGRPGEIDDTQQHLILHFPDGIVGRIIGKGGEDIKRLRAMSQCRIETDKAGECTNGLREVRITGPLKNCAVAMTIMEGVIASKQ